MDTIFFGDGDLLFVDRLLDTNLTQFLQFSSVLQPSTWAAVWARWD